MTDLRQSELRVAAELARHELPGTVTVLDQLATTAQMAADALGIEIGRIVKSLLFVGVETGEPIMVLVSGANRVHERRTSRQIGQKLGRADADLVREATGFAIGGVSPFGHLKPMSIYIDEDLFSHATVWAAAGNARSVFEITPSDLERTTGAKRIVVT
ncbi:YbaK/EbsC family protein [Pelagibacterium luteolum]|uniref:Cys-tRNA(Pro) deacylase, prolyl-tRNA editing enzyme YbaK/EbsC n=1 Tax=Pelagibacterium luteolum TaxID=440168 RepID=A0A1G7UIX3_9HYPH|nr:YbaK/EbsC family protein [Pelagibacterium luteolum]SDG47019.1 Cys-tRNA(Pro) deacylase, prolyl-tRNA editing enzyme YbaK/EbsC [Pelagibacterium luteolum]